MADARPVRVAEEWEFLDGGELRPNRTGAICNTYPHFSNEYGSQSVTLLTSPIHRGLIPQGEHLTKRCAQWMARRELVAGWCPEEA